MEKKKFVVLLTSILATGSLCTTAALGIKKGMNQKEEGGLQIHGLSGITFTNMRTLYASDGAVTKKVNYTLTPVDADVKTFDTYLAFRGESEDYSWSKEEAATKNPADYMTVTLDTDNKTITFACSQPFGSMLTYSMIYPENPSIQANVYMDYERKISSSAEMTLPNGNVYTNGVGLQYQTKENTYTIGTKGRKSDDIEVSVDYNDTDSYFASLIKVNNPSTYSSTMRYLGANYTSNSALAASMATNVKNYLISCVTSDGSVLYQRSEMMKYLSFQYIVHTYKDEYVNTNEAYYKFTENYHNAFEKGKAITLTFKVNNEVKKSQLLDIASEEQALRNLSIDNANLTF